MTYLFKLEEEQWKLIDSSGIGFDSHGNKIPEGVNKSILQEIYTIFTKNPGDNNVEIEICGKRLSLDIKVNKTRLNNELINSHL
jgi:hypothetical protein